MKCCEQSGVSGSPRVEAIVSSAPWTGLDWTGLASADLATGSCRTECRWQLDCSLTAVAGADSSVADAARSPFSPYELASTCSHSKPMVLTR